MSVTRHYIHIIYEELENMQLVFQNHCMCFSERKQIIYCHTLQGRIWNLNPINFLWLTNQALYIVNLPYFFRGWEIWVPFSENLEILRVRSRMGLEGSIGNGTIEKPRKGSFPTIEAGSCQFTSGSICKPHRWKWACAWHCEIYAKPEFSPQPSSLTPPLHSSCPC